MKIVLSKSITAIFCKIIIIIPSIVGILVCFLNPNPLIEFAIFGIIISILIYEFQIGWYVGYIKFNKEYLYVPGDIMFKLNRLQYRTKVFYNDIKAIEFKACDGNSKGKKLWRAWGINYLILYLSNDDSVKISINKFSHKQWYQIQKLILKQNDKIQILGDVDELIKFNSLW